jgi:hypothetical protein
LGKFAERYAAGGIKMYERYGNTAHTLPPLPQMTTWYWVFTRGASFDHATRGCSRVMTAPEIRPILILSY